MSTIVASGLTDPYAIGSPANNGAYFDGARYWLFYTIGSEIRCKFGTGLSSMSDSATAVGGTGNITSIRNDGQCYAVLFGTVSGTPYAWCLFSESTAGRGAVMLRWELSSTGLANPVENVASTADSDRWYASLTPNFSGDVDELLEFLQTGTSFGNTRSNNAALSDDTGLGSIDSTAIDLPEQSRVFQLADGYLALALDQGATGEQSGNFGHAREWLRPDLATAWGSEGVVEGNVASAASNDGDFTDQNCAVGTSQTGQQDIAQTADGKIWVAYCDNSDLTNGNHGVVKLVRRGEMQADGWTLVSNDVIGGDASAWHMALASDGADLWVFYVKDVAGVRDTAIHYRKFDTSDNSLDPETKLADLQPSHSFERMFTQWRLDSEMHVVAWSETDGSTFDVVMQAVSTTTVPETSGWGPKQILTVASVRRAVSIS